MALPKLFLRPVRDNYAGIPGATVVATQLSGGASRMRKDQIGASFLITINWILEGDDYDYIWAFYSSSIDEGSEAFCMDLIVDAQGLQEVKCQIVPGSFQLTAQTGLAYFMQAQLEVFPNPRDPANDAILTARNDY